MAIGWEASDLFAAGANFHEQESSSIDMDDRSFMLDKSGNVECETMVNGRVEYSNRFAYCSGTPNIATDLGTLLTQFGNVADSKAVTTMSISFRAGAYAEVTIDGHQHDANAHSAGIGEGYADVSAAIPASAGFGVPTLTGQTIGTDASPVSLTITFNMNHIDKIGADGTHFTGKNLTCTAELSEEFEGTPSGAEATDWTTDSKGGADSSENNDTYTYTAHRYFDLTTS